MTDVIGEAVSLDYRDKIVQVVEHPILTLRFGRHR
jgi:hypothetical protein